MVQLTNTPGEPADREPFRWLNEPRWYLWEGGFLLIGSGQGAVPPHAHHAIQIVMAMDGRVAIRGQDDPWREGSGVVVQPDIVHSFDAQGAWAAMLFVDPQNGLRASGCGPRWLRTSRWCQKHGSIRPWRRSAPSRNGRWKAWTSAPSFVIACRR